MAIQIKSKVRQCYTNCSKAILFDYSNKYRYVEGLMNYRGIPLEHGFLINMDNEVVDITMGIDQKIRTMKAKEIGIDLKEKDHDFGSEYFGVIIPRIPLIKIFRTKAITYRSTLDLYYNKLKEEKKWVWQINFVMFLV